MALFKEPLEVRRVAKPNKPVLKKQPPPYSIQIEPTAGCNLRCAMCGIQGITTSAGKGPLISGGPGRPAVSSAYSFMTPATAEGIAKAIAEAQWNPRIEFALRGEPLLNPDMTLIVRTFRSYLPDHHLMITTNAIPLLKPPGVHRRLDELFDSGLTLLAVDNYELSQKAVAKIKTYRRVPIRGYGNVEDVPSGPTPYARRRGDDRSIVIMEDMEAAARRGEAVGTKLISNHCGAGMPTVATQSTRCARPFREMVIRYDGHLAMCCIDWRDVINLGNVTDYDSLDLAWNNPVLQALRRKLYHKDRSEYPCSVCNERSFRVGLLPDKKGKYTLPKPTKGDTETLRKAAADGPHTVPVLRPWEESPLTQCPD